MWYVTLDSLPSQALVTWTAKCIELDKVSYVPLACPTYNLGIVVKCPSSSIPSVSVSWLVLRDDWGCFETEAIWSWNHGTSLPFWACPCWYHHLSVWLKISCPSKKEMHIWIFCLKKIPKVNDPRLPNRMRQVILHLFVYAQNKALPDCLWGFIFFLQEWAHRELQLICDVFILSKFLITFVISKQNTLLFKKSQEKVVVQQNQGLFYSPHVLHPLLISSFPIFFSTSTTTQTNNQILIET